MEQKKKSKYIKVGVVRTSEKSKGPFVALGQRAKEAKYERNVEIRVTDGDGNVLSTIKNGILTIQDPRKNPNATQEQVDRVPDWLKHELFIVEKT